MAKLRIDEIAKLRGIKNAHQLQLALSMTSPSKAVRLWNGDVGKIDLAIIEQLCVALKCSPADLLAPETIADWPKRIYQKR